MYKVLAFILRIVITPILWVYLCYFTMKSVLKHKKFFDEYHPNMDTKTKQDRVVENVVSDIQKFRRSLGIRDGEME